MKKFYRVAKTIKSEVSTTYGNVIFTRTVPVDVTCEELEEETYNSGVKKGDRIRIVAGRKNPIGTEGTVKWVGLNKFGTSFRNPITGKEIHLNPSIRLTLDDGSEVWTVGNNCINLSVGEIKEFNTKEEVKEWEKSIKTFFEEDVWYLQDKQIIKAGNLFFGLGSKGFAIHKGMIKEGKTEVAAVIDDFTTDTYSFVKFSKEAKHGNLIKIVSTGESRNWDRMWDGDTGLTDATKAFEGCEVA